MTSEEKQVWIRDNVLEKSKNADRAFYSQLFKDAGTMTDEDFFNKYDSWLKSNSRGYSSWRQKPSTNKERIIRAFDGDWNQPERWIKEVQEKELSDIPLEEVKKNLAELRSEEEAKASETQKEAKIKSVDDKAIAKALGYRNVEAMYKDSDWQNIPGSEIKGKLTSAGIDFSSALSHLSKEQTVRNREKIYEETPWYVKMFTPRSAEAIKEGRDPTTGEIFMDIGEDIASALPLGRGASATAGLLKRGATAIGTSALVPVGAAIGDVVVGNKTPEEALTTALTGTAINLGAASSMGALGRGIDYLIKTGREKIGYNLSKENELFLKTIKEKLSKPESISSEELIRLQNIVNLYEDKIPGLKSSMISRIKDPSVTGPIGEARQKAYQAEMKGFEESPSIKERLYAQERKSYTENLSPEELAAYEARQTAVYPTDVVDPERYAIDPSGRITTKFKEGVSELSPEFKTPKRVTGTKEYLLSSQRAEEAAKHSSKTFVYPNEFDKVVEEYMKDPQISKLFSNVDMNTTKKIIAGAINAGEDVYTYAVNKLGRSEWARPVGRQVTRIFGEEEKEPEIPIEDMTNKEVFEEEKKIQSSKPSGYEKYLKGFGAKELDSRERAILDKASMLHLYY